MTSTIQRQHLNTSTESTQDQVPLIAKLSIPLLWILFAVFVGLLCYYTLYTPTWNFGTAFRITSFTLLIGVVVTFFSAIVSTYAHNYLKGFKFHQKFTLLSLGFTCSVLLFVMSNHVLALIGFWFAMGFFMSRLIGVNSDWGEAKAAAKFAQKNFLFGTLFFAAGILILAFSSNVFTLSALFLELHTIPHYLVLLASLFIIVAALVQSAVYPFHRWLLSAMTAPTPASALMHAGFVNGSGILLTLLAPLLILSNTLTLLFIIGGLTAILAQFTKLLQTNVKHKLACSTIAQMGFMIMQCGLGFFNAAVAHLILHGFYKAYLFLSSGEEIAQSNPQQAEVIRIKPLQALVVLIFGIAGATFFAFATGKTNTTDSSIFLTLIVAITVGQVTYNIIKQSHLSWLQKTFAPIALFLLGIGSYALIYNGVTRILQDMPMIEVPQELSIWHIVFGIIFLLGFFIMKLGVYQRVPWIYVKLMNISQPHHTTFLNFKK
jgi:NAD(P)H-quinone oxidoreductase subunit 5